MLSQSVTESFKGFAQLADATTPTLDSASSAPFVRLPRFAPLPLSTLSQRSTRFHPPMGRPSRLSGGASGSKGSSQRLFPFAFPDFLASASGAASSAKAPTLSKKAAAAAAAAATKAKAPSKAKKIPEGLSQTVVAIYSLNLSTSFFSQEEDEEGCVRLRGRRRGRRR